MNIALLALGVFVSSFLIAIFISKFIATGAGEEIRTPMEDRESDELFIILCLICLPIIAIVVGQLSGFWDWMDK